MRLRSALIPAALMAATVPLGVQAAGLSAGANIGSARVNEGDFDGSDMSWKAYVGSSFREIFGGELAYVDFGDLGGDGPRAKAWAPAVTAGLPIGQSGVRLYGKLGVAFAETEGTAVSEEFKNEDPFYGVGLSIGQQRGLGFRVEYERYRFEQQFGNVDLDLAQAGLEFRF